MDEDYEETAAGRMWGIWSEDGHPGDLPLALFPTQEEAEDWRSEQELQFSPIMRADVQLSYWNGPADEDPKGKESRA